MSNNQFNIEEKELYSRHLMLQGFGVDAQFRLKQSKVLIIGAGGLGCPIIQYLTAAGIGTIGVLDDDIISKSNLQRQVLYTFEHIGQKKAEVACQIISKSNPLIKSVCHPLRLDSSNAIDIFTQYDLIIDGSDNFQTRYLVNDACILTNKPYVFGSIYQFEGQVSVFNYQNGPSYRCLFPQPPKAGTILACGDIGVLGVLPGVIGTIMATESIKILTKVGKVLSGKLLIYDALKMNFEKLLFDKDENSPSITTLIDYDYFCGIKSDYNLIDFSTSIFSNPEYKIIDVREPQEFDADEFGGENIPLSEIEFEYKKFDSNQKTIFLCQTGARSKRAIDILKNKKVDVSHFYVTGIVK